MRGNGLDGNDDIVFVKFSDANPFFGLTTGFKGLNQDYINVKVLLSDLFDPDGSAFTISSFDCTKIEADIEEFKMLGTFEAAKQAYPEYFL